MKTKHMGLFLIGGPLSIYAAMACASPGGEPSRIGDSTQAWMTMQAEGTAAAPAAPMTGAQASAAYTRYLKSFEDKIPEHFGSSLKDSASAGASGG